MDPQNPRVLFNLANYYQKDGELRQAAAKYFEAIAVDPTMEDAYIALARVLVEDDRYDMARRVLANFIRSYPRSTRRPLRSPARGA